MQILNIPDSHLINITVFAASKKNHFTFPRLSQAFMIAKCKKRNKGTKGVCVCMYVCICSQSVANHIKDTCVLPL